MDDVFYNLNLEFWDCVDKNDRYGMWRVRYEIYMNVESCLWFNELYSIRGMAIFTRLSVDNLNDMNYYFETIGDYKKAQVAIQLKEAKKNSFRNMIKLLIINKPQYN